MKKKGRWLLSMLCVLLCAAATGAYVLFNVLRDDETAPRIEMLSEELEISVTAADAELLQGVTAWDEEDGDVTDELVVEGISNITEEHTAVVTYAAFDRAGNVSKATRTLLFTDYEDPVFGLRQALVFQSNAAPDVLSYVSVSDKVDGDISRRVKGLLVSDTNSLSFAGVHSVEFRVTNSMGDTEYITLPVDVLQAGDYNATVQLSDYLIYLKKNAAFQPETYLKNLIVGGVSYPLKHQDADAVQSDAQQIYTYINRYVDPAQNSDPNVLIVNVDMDSDVDTGTPGVYSVTYHVTMDDRYVGFTRLNVVVEE